MLPSGSLGNERFKHLVRIQTSKKKALSPDGKTVDLERWDAGCLVTGLLLVIVAKHIDSNMRGFFLTVDTK